MDAPLVAIVTPVYNGGAYLRETLESVQAQTYPNLVHIVLDNASTDATADILASAAQDRVPIVVTRNAALLPQQANWEKAVRLSPPDARYFLLLSADDLIAPDAIAQLVAIAEADARVGVVGCRWREFTPEGHVEASRGGLPEDRSIFDGRWFVKAYLTQLHFATSPQCQLFRRAVLDETANLYAHYEMLMDVDACLGVLMRWKYGFAHQSLGYTRAHPGSITQTVAGPAQAFLANWLALIDRYGQQVMSPAEFAICRRAYLRYYYRRLLLWRFSNAALYRNHRGWLREHAAAPGAADYAEALLEWAWLAVRNRRSDVSRAPSLWARVRAELDAAPMAPEELAWPSTL